MKENVYRNELYVWKIRSKKEFNRNDFPVLLRHKLKSLYPKSVCDKV